MQQDRLITRPASSFHWTLDEGALQQCYQGHHSAKPRSVVAGPFDFWQLDSVRRDRGLHTSGAIAADLFVFAIGEAPHPGMTRLGGIPYLPRSTPWPARNGKPAQFYAQLNFKDSKDLVPFAPADVLLVFGHFDSDFTSWDRELYEFVWVDIDEAEPHYAESDVPPGGLDSFPSLFGVRVRSWDDPRLVGRLRAEKALSPHVHVAKATKAGGCPSDRQGIDPPEVPPGWRFLGQVTGIWPATDVPFPVLRHPDAVTRGDGRYDKLVNGPGDGVTCLFLDERDEVQIYFSCG